MKHRTAGFDGFSLVEVTLALGVASFCLMAVFALLPIGLQTNRASTAQTASAGILSTVIADMRAAPATGLSAQFGISLGTSKELYFDSEGRSNDALGSTSRYRVTITFPSGAPTANVPVFASLRVTWPAAADPATASGESRMFAAFSHR